jgi:hypothetical protein
MMEQKEKIVGQKCRFLNNVLPPTDHGLSADEL